MSNWILFTTSFRKSIRLMRRYMFNTALLVFSMYLVFLTLFLGGQLIAPSFVAGSLGAVVVGYFLWTMAVTGYQTTTQDMTREAQWGTLEQIYMSPYGIWRILVTKCIVNIAVSLLLGTVLLVLMLLTTRETIQLDFLTVIPIGLVTLVGPISIGIVLGGLAILYKRVEQAMSLLQIAFVVFIAIPIETHAATKLLPLTLGSHMLQQAMTEGTRLWEFPAMDLALLIGKAALFVATSYVVFNMIQRRARKRGVLGHY